MTARALLIPRSVDEAVGSLKEHGRDLLVMGGGTIVMHQINDGYLFPKMAMSLARAGMDGVRQVNGHLEIGATATPAQLALLDSLPPLAQVAAQLGGPAVRNMATIGGNLFVAPPYGDLAVPLLALDAQVRLAGAGGTRTMPIEAFLAGRDAAPADPPELVTALLVPLPQGRTAYLKLGRRAAVSPSVATVVVHVVLGADGTCTAARIALGAAGPHALRAHRAEAALVGHQLGPESIAAAAAAAVEECDPPTDALASAWYRRRMVGVYVRRALEALLTQ